jgi:protein required for attachment to host cells
MGRSRVFTSQRGRLLGCSGGWEERDSANGREGRSRQPEIVPRLRVHGRVWMEPARTWIVVADSAVARIFAAEARNQPWQLVEEISHPESRSKGTELMTDMPAMERGELPKEGEARVFARQLGDRINLAQHQRAFDALVLVAPPEFMGLLRKVLSVAASRCVEETITKDLAQLKQQDLQDRLSGAV